MVFLAMVCRAFFFLSLLLWGFQGAGLAAGVSVITDLDDTLKISQSNRPCALLYQVLSHNVYGAASDFYGGFDDGELFVVSASPRVLKKHISNTLKRHSLQARDLYLKPIFLSGGTFKFKAASLEDIFAKTKETYILIGDNTSQDAAAFLDIQEKYPDRVAGVYIRHMLHKPIPLGAKPFYTYYEVALDQYLKGNMSYEEVQKVAVAIMQSEPKKLFPRGHICPSLYLLPLVDSLPLNRLSNQIMHFVQGLCS